MGVLREKSKMLPLQFARSCSRVASLIISLSTPIKERICALLIESRVSRNIPYL